METDPLNSVGEVRPGECEVLQSASQTLVGSRISHRITQISRQLRLSVDRSGAGLGVEQGLEWSRACNQSSQPAPEYRVHTTVGEGEDQTSEAQQ